MLRLKIVMSESISSNFKISNGPWPDLPSAVPKDIVSRGLPLLRRRPFPLVPLLLLECVDVSGSGNGDGSSSTDNECGLSRYARAGRKAGDNGCLLGVGPLLLAPGTYLPVLTPVIPGDSF